MNTILVPAERQEPRRLRRIGIGPEGFLGLLRLLDGNRRIVCSGLPDDARVVHAYSDPDTMTWWVVFESDTFAPAPEGTAILWHNVQFTVTEEVE